MAAAMSMERCRSELGAEPDLLDERRRDELSGGGFARTRNGTLPTIGPSDSVR